MRKGRSASGFRSAADYPGPSGKPLPPGSDRNDLPEFSEPRPPPSSTRAERSQRPMILGPFRGFSRAHDVRVAARLDERPELNYKSERLPLESSVRALKLSVDRDRQSTRILTYRHLKQEPQ